jgi:hypothetical protein
MREEMSMVISTNTTSLASAAFGKDNVDQSICQRIPREYVSLVRKQYKEQAENEQKKSFIARLFGI